MLTDPFYVAAIALALSFVATAARLMDWFLHSDFALDRAGQPVDGRPAGDRVDPAARHASSEPEMGGGDGARSAHAVFLLAVRTTLPPARDVGERASRYEQAVARSIRGPQRVIDGRACIAGCRRPRGVPALGKRDPGGGQPAARFAEPAARSAIAERSAQACSRRASERCPRRGRACRAHELRGCTRNSGARPKSDAYRGRTRAQAALREAAAGSRRLTLPLRKNWRGASRAHRRRGRDRPQARCAEEAPQSFARRGAVSRHH